MIELRQYLIDNGYLTPLNNTINKDFLCISSSKIPWLYSNEKEHTNFYISISRKMEPNTKLKITTIEQFLFFKDMFNKQIEKEKINDRE